MHIWVGHTVDVCYRRDFNTISWNTSYLPSEITRWSITIDRYIGLFNSIIRLLKYWTEQQTLGVTLRHYSANPLEVSSQATVLQLYRRYCDDIPIANIIVSELAPHNNNSLLCFGYPRVKNRPLRQPIKLQESL